MNFKNIKTTAFKELRAITRDKKALLMIFIMPLFAPIFIIFYGFLYNNMSDTKYVIGTNYELNSNEQQIVNEVGGMEFKYYATEEELDKAYENSDISLYIIKNDKKYELCYDAAKQSSLNVLPYAQAYLESYNMYLANNYLMEQDINADEALQNIEVEMRPLGEDENGLLSLIISLIVPFIGMSIIYGTITLATDAAAGEKERGTMETLLTFPIKSEEIIGGKLLATSIIGVFSGVCSFILSIISIHIAKNTFEIFADTQFNISFLVILITIFVIVMLALLSSGVCFAIAGNTKSYKEAQSALTPVSFIALLPMFLTMLEINNIIFDLVPIANCIMILNDLLFGTVNYLNIIIMIISTILYIALILIYISKQYKSEKTLFS